jgi:hypothetical protein
VGRSGHLDSKQSHHPLVVGADVPVADVISLDDQNVGFVCRMKCRNNHTYAQNNHCKKH